VGNMRLQPLTGRLGRGALRAGHPRLCRERNSGAKLYSSAYKKANNYFYLVVYCLHYANTTAILSQYSDGLRAGVPGFDSRLHRYETYSGAYSVSCPIRSSGRSPPTRAEVKKAASVLPHVFVE
jgi:hypothetical protein